MACEFPGCVGIFQFNPADGVGSFEFLLLAVVGSGDDFSVFVAFLVGVVFALSMSLSLSLTFAFVFFLFGRSCWKLQEWAVQTLKGWVAGTEVIAHCLDYLAEVEIFGKGRMCVEYWEALTDRESDVWVESNFDSRCDEVGCVLEDDVDSVGYLF